MGACKIRLRPHFPESASTCDSTWAMLAGVPLLQQHIHCPGMSSVDQQRRAGARLAGSRLLRQHRRCPVRGSVGQWSHSVARQA